MANLGRLPIADFQLPIGEEVRLKREAGFQKSAIGNRQLTILLRLSQIVIDHPTPIFFRLRYRSVTTLFVATNSILGVQPFEYKLASRHESRTLRTIKIKGKHRRSQQLRN